MDEIVEEVKVLEKMGHKRLALEVDEDPINCPIEYVIDAIKVIYTASEEQGAIRRVKSGHCTGLSYSGNNHGPRF